MGDLRVYLKSNNNCNVCWMSSLNNTCVVRSLSPSLSTSIYLLACWLLFLLLFLFSLIVYSALSASVQLSFDSPSNESINAIEPLKASRVECVFFWLLNIYMHGQIDQHTHINEENSLIFNWSEWKWSTEQTKLKTHHIKSNINLN